MPSQTITTTTDLSKQLRYIDSWSFAENAADPGGEARVLLRDGTAGGTIVADIRIPAKGCDHEAYFKPLYCPNGVYVMVSIGTVRGVVSGS